MLKKLNVVFIAVLLSSHTVFADSADTLNKIRQSGIINIGHRQASIPFSFTGPNQQPIGYSIDLCMRIVEAVKIHLKMDNLKIKFVPVNPHTRIPLLVNGSIDMECGSTTNTLTRQAQVDYLSTIFVSGAKLLVNRNSGIKEIEDLKGKTIALAADTTSERAVKTLIKEQKLNLKIISVQDHDEGFQALKSAQAQAYATDDVLLYGLLSEELKPDNYAVVGRFLSFDPYAIMVRRNDANFRLIGNKVLSKLFRTGEINTLYNKWFSRIDMPMSDLLKSTFIVQALPL